MSLLLALGCYSQADYNADEHRATCGWYERCDNLGVLGFESYDDCVAELDGVEPMECPVFDAGAGRDCVDAIEAKACDEIESPAACAAVCSEAEE